MQISQHFAVKESELKEALARSAHELSRKAFELEKANLKHAHALSETKAAADRQRDSLLETLATKDKHIEVRY